MILVKEDSCTSIIAANLNSAVTRTGRSDFHSVPRGVAGVTDLPHSSHANEYAQILKRSFGNTRQMSSSWFQNRRSITLDVVEKARKFQKNTERSENGNIRPPDLALFEISVCEVRQLEIELDRLTQIVPNRKEVRQSCMALTHLTFTPRKYHESS